MTKERTKYIDIKKNEIYSQENNPKDFTKRFQESYEIKLFLKQ
jgi:hypothetical protein